MSDPAAGDPGLFDGILAAGPVAAMVGDRAWVQAMLDFEGALARAEADTGLIPAGAATAIESECRAAYYDPAALGAAAVGIGNPAGPLVGALTARVAGDAAGYVHLGATSQDVVDTAAMLVTARALAALDAELRAVAARLAELAETHTDTVLAGRSLLQQATPITFGFAAAGWLGGVLAARERLAAVRAQRLAVQFGGAVGTLAALGDNGIDVLERLAGGLGLAVPLLPWHTERSRITEVAAALGQTCGAVAKIARDLTLLAQTEVAEIAEEGPPGSGGSSTMPHKRNPVAAVLAAAAAAQAPGLVADLLAAAAHDHQRAAGSWHAEWRPYRELLRTTGSAVHWLRIALDRLRADPVRMRANLDRTGGLLLAENVSVELLAASGGALGRQQAGAAVTACCRAALSGAGELAELLAADATIGKYLSRSRIDELLDPAGYLGSAREFVTRTVLRWHEVRDAGEDVG
ncbi:3-carboxy-cis,cis-muconate cycloisomerase [Nocardia sp. alder85J]|uniref:3-carboxy-cis,cis-muconate cycloisomerase n=1 Tax=Nocardia sp. alder85J TaxID=2862949 RepID=UPI001CD7A7DC|nr:3-carboxy-cis,cis-muconate cycloisomerase [Nocardia sp. alder85J]MCX4091368.1 3-carboxy-cis,cis-muconate cycloisomerase [Nocardia sp. alder85J]